MQTASDARAFLRRRRVVHGISSDPVTVPTGAERIGDFSNTPFTFDPANPRDPTKTALIQSQLFADILNNRAGCHEGTVNVGDAYHNLFPGDKIPVACFDPVAVDLTRFVPCPNDNPGCADTTP